MSNQADTYSPALIGLDHNVRELFYRNPDGLSLNDVMELSGLPEPDAAFPLLRLLKEGSIVEDGFRYHGKDGKGMTHSVMYFKLNPKTREAIDLQ